MSWTPAVVALWARRLGCHRRCGMDDDVRGTELPEPDDDGWDRAESPVGGGYWPPAPRPDVGTRLPDRRVRASTGHAVEV